MTNEQREAIKKLEYVNRRYDCNNYYSRYELDCIDTVLSLIKEQQEEIEGLKDKEVLIKRYFNKCDLIKQKDKQIDLIIDFIRERSIYAVDTHEKLKQYFADKVNSSEQN